METSIRLTPLMGVVVLAATTVLHCNARADDATEEQAKPTISLHKDGFPTGHGTPEGVACDLARAFIARDAELFADACAKPFGAGEARTAYERFLKRTSDAIEAEARKDVPSPGGPKRIAKVFAARHLSLNGPASWGFAAFGFQDVMFVDVGAILENNDRYLNRTLVIKSKEGHWYAHPLPSAYPLLSRGLNDESASTTDFKEAYTIAPANAK